MTARIERGYFSRQQTVKQRLVPLKEVWNDKVYDTHGVTEDRRSIRQEAHSRESEGG